MQENRELLSPNGHHTTIELNQMIRPYLIILLLLVGIIRANGQKYTLDQSINLAQQQSLDAFRAKYMFKLQQFDYLDFKTALLPQVDLNFKPVSYNRSIVEVYDSNTKRYESVEVQRLSSNYDVGINQKVGLTNGTLRLHSSLSRSEQYGNNSYVNYVSNPVSISYSQSLFGSNSYRWQSRVAPLKFDQAKLDFIEKQELIALQTIDLFFSVLSAQTNFQIAQLNKTNADSLLVIGERRKELGSISRDALLNLKLKQVNASISLDQSKNRLKDTKRDFCEFLEIPFDKNISCTIPNQGLLNMIEPQLALDIAMENNPKIHSLQRKLLEVEERLELAKKARYRMNVNVSFGFNQNKPTFDAAFQDLLNSQSANVTLSMPILDWGNNKRKIARARLNKTLVEMENEKSIRQVKIMISKNTDAFNIRKKEVMTAAIADTISQSAYEATQQRFVLGKVNVIDINEAYKSLYSAKNSYINAVRKYWTAYYTMRKICLFDFMSDQNLRSTVDNKLELD